jgi:adenine-specific DNA-methyltransferase
LIHVFRQLPWAFLRTDLRFDEDSLKTQSLCYPNHDVGLATETVKPLDWLKLLLCVDRDFISLMKFRYTQFLKPADRQFGIACEDVRYDLRVKILAEQNANHELLPKGSRVYRLQPMEPSGPMESGRYTYEFEGQAFPPPKNGYSVTKDGMDNLAKAGRLQIEGRRLRFVTYLDETRTSPITAPWSDTIGADDKNYVVQTNSNVIGRCLAMTTDPGDIVLDPTCGGGTTAIAAERMGRRWITIDTSRVAINVTRQRLLSAVFPHFVLKGSGPSSGFYYEEETRVTIGSIANRLEPHRIEMRTAPKTDESAIRVTGPFELLTIGRYSIEDWKGYSVVPGLEGAEQPRLEDYIRVVCRLYRKDAAVQGAAGFIHAVSESERETIGISVGPLSGRVTGKQVNDAVQDALSAGILEVHVLGWAFEANVGEVKAQLEKRNKVKVELIMIRPDTLAEGLKITKSEMLFSPLALPDIDVNLEKGAKTPQVVVCLKGVAVFDRKNRNTDYKRGDSGYISAWYLDEDYDGDCFVDSQMFFDFKKVPNLKALGIQAEPTEFTLQLESQPFAIRGYKRIAVKVVDVYGNESTTVKDL